MQVIRLKPYLRAMAAIGLVDSDMQQIEAAILAALDAHPIVKGLPGARKARFARPGTGKSGGGRTIYYLTVSPDRLIMMTAYAKSERDDLSPQQRREILRAIESIKGG
jgi:hypothetical protein